VRQKKNGEIEITPMSIEDLAIFALDHENISSFGLKYLIFIREQAMLGGGHTIEDIFKAICSIHKKSIEPPELVVESNEVSAEAAQQENSVNEANYGILLRQLEELQSRVCIKY